MATGTVAITPGTGEQVRVVRNSGVDSNGTQQIMTLADDQGDMIAQSAIPAGTEDGLLTRSLPSRIVRTGFSDAITGGVDPAWGTLRSTGSGMSVNQSSSNLVITTGTTANAETIIRGLATFAGGVRLRCRSTLSQRIANQSFFVELVDVQGDSLAITINSSTQVTVTFPSGQNPFTAGSVGQSAYLGGYSGSGTFVPGRYAIASVSGDTAVFTVSGFASGSGTCSVFGWNYHHVLYDGTSATNTKWGTSRKGWATGDTSVSINSTSSPGHLAVIAHNDMQAGMLDALVASSSTTQYTARGSSVENVPDDTALRVQIRVVNGATAPASTTTWTIGHVAVGNFAPQDVAVQDVRPQHSMSALPVQVVGTGGGTVQVANTPNVSVSNTPSVVPNGGTDYLLTTTASTNANVVKSSAGNLDELVIENPTTTAAWLKFYRKASTPTVGTDVPVYKVLIPAATTATTAPALLEKQYGPLGKRFTTGLAIAVTGAAADSDTTSAVAGIKIHLTYV